jgi:HEAT-like repeat
MDCWGKWIYHKSIRKRSSPGGNYLASLRRGESPLEKEKVKPGKLLSDLCSPDECVKWAAVLTMGAYVSDVAQNDLEAARNWMRRFMWQLNEESGGIGWGVAEVMGEAMARNETLAWEFGRILLSYLDEDGNYLEFEPLQRGALWGVGRLAKARPDLLKSFSAPRYIAPFLRSSSAPLRGLAVRALGWIGDPESLPLIRSLRNDPAEIRIFNGEGLETRSIWELAEEASKKFTPH